MLSIIGIFTWRYWNEQKIAKITTFEECAAAGYPIMESNPAMCVTPDEKYFTQQIEKMPSSSISTSGQQISINGEIICSPHKNTAGPITSECAFGLKGDDGKNYALADPAMKYPISLAAGTKVQITGKLNESTESKYNTVGTIEIISLTIIGN